MVVWEGVAVWGINFINSIWVVRIINSASAGAFYFWKVVSSGVGGSQQRWAQWIFRAFNLNEHNNFLLSMVVKEKRVSPSTHPYQPLASASPFIYMAWNLRPHKQRGVKSLPKCDHMAIIGQWCHHYSCPFPYISDDSLGNMLHLVVSFFLLADIENCDWCGSTLWDFFIFFKKDLSKMVCVFFKLNFFF